MDDDSTALWCGLIGFAGLVVVLLLLESAPSNKRYTSGFLFGLPVSTGSELPESGGGGWSFSEGSGQVNGVTKP